MARGRQGLRALLLFGSRARGDAAATSDWDLGYLAESSFDPAALLADLVRALGTERIDLVDLSAASGLLRFRAAREGVALLGDADVADFRIAAASFWCDAEPILRGAYDAVLERL
ncbi:nucleotidyltransferase domain-containing protein [Candidatus Binatia bacterium]|nr:nucleotidyltransferase domain-containing protein [Candidatus Binatia bacterium]